MRYEVTPLVAKPENCFRLAKSGEFEVAQRDEFSRQTPGEGGRSDNGSTETGGDFFQARGEIDRRADSIEVEARARADIAVERFPNM